MSSTFTLTHSLAPHDTDTIQITHMKGIDAFRVHFHQKRTREGTTDGDALWITHVFIWCVLRACGLVVLADTTVVTYKADFNCETRQKDHNRMDRDSLRRLEDMFRVPVTMDYDAAPATFPEITEDLSPIVGAITIADTRMDVKLLAGYSYEHHFTAFCALETLGGRLITETRAATRLQRAARRYIARHFHYMERPHRVFGTVRVFCRRA